ncbi:MAG: hypothetical protein H6569_05955 [Lewinellaceae bacterium]|nr:hypothetical protein [Lewinellaceae bacterium]
MSNQSDPITKYTFDELTLRLKCLNIAAMIQPDSVPSDLCEIARMFYYWLTTDGDIEQFFIKAEDPDGLLWEGTTSK